jgi:hypothetical protein
MRRFGTLIVGKKEMRVKLMLALSAIIFSQALFGDVLSGVGYAPSDGEAKREALADLSQVIKSEVRSSFESISKTQNDKGETSASSNIKISSNLPILGVEFSVIQNYEDVEATVTLTPSKVKSVYAKKLQDIKREIASSLHELKMLEKPSTSLRLKLYEDVFSLLKEYDRYESVANVIGVSPQPRPEVTKARVKVALEKLRSNIDSLSMASEVLAKEFGEEKIFIYPPLLENSTSASQFSSVFLKELKSKIKSVKTPKEASRLLVGEYTLTSKSIVLSYELLNVKTNEVEKSKTITIDEKAYSGLKMKPENIDFDALLNSGVVNSSALRVSLNSNRGSENLLFNEGEDVELFVKLNKMGYFYVVGYTQTPNGTLSYLLELQEGIGNSKFVKFVNADDASKWMSLGEFSVEKPFGVESLQVMASNHEVTTLPSTFYDEASGYYVISNDIKKALTTSRGLKKKKSAKDEFSEDVMSFTTMRR